MDSDDLFEQDYKHHKHGHDHHYGHDKYYQRSHSSMHHNDLKYMLISKLQNNPKVKALLILAGIILMIILVIVAILIIPLVVKLFHYISQNGIQGLLDIIWKGTK